MRDSFLKGVGISVMWDETLFLFIFAFIMFNLAVTRFKRRSSRHVREDKGDPHKGIKQVLRDPRMKVVIFISPLVQVILFDMRRTRI